MMTKQEIGQILRKARETKGLTQKQVAGMLGRTQQIVGHWETGYAQPDANTLFALCDIYQISIDEAFGNKKESSDVLNDCERNLLQQYRSLDSIGKELLQVAMAFALKHHSNDPLPIESTETVVLKKVRMPVITGVMDGTIETAFAAKQELREMIDASDPVIAD